MGTVLFSGSAGNYYRTTSHPGITAAGSIFIRCSPTWAHNDSVTHVLWEYSTGTGASESPQIMKYSNNNVYAGFSTAGGGDQRMIFAATAAMFTNGTWTNHLFTWDDTANTQEYFADDVSKASSSNAFARDSVTELTIGEFSSISTGGPAASSMCEFGRWNRILSTAERAILQATGTPLSVWAGLVEYRPLRYPHTGAQPDLIGGVSLSLTGTLAAGVDAPRIWMPSRGEGAMLVGTVAAGGGGTGRASALALMGIG